MFAGKNFLDMKPPPGYIPGAGRGAVGFSTDSIRPKPRAGPRNSKRGGPQSDNASQVEQERFVDADEEADDIYAMIERKRRRKNSKRPSAALAPDLHVTSEPLGAVSMDEWLRLPDPRDSTKRNQRLRHSSRQHMRFYNASDQLALTQEDVRLADLERKRPMLESMVEHQPANEEGYLQLAELELEFGRHSKAKSIVMKGVVSCATERLWLKALELHDGVSALSLAAKACTKLPRSELLWLRRIELTQTAAEKLVLVHEALLTCLKSEKLWLLAAELETDPAVKEEVLNTARKFVPLNTDILETSTEGSTDRLETNTEGNTDTEGITEGSTEVNAEGSTEGNTEGNTEGTEGANTEGDGDGATTEGANIHSEGAATIGDSKGAVTNVHSEGADAKGADAKGADSKGADSDGTFSGTFSSNTSDAKTGTPLFVRRAALSKATRQDPHNPDLWVDRIECEKQDGKPFGHILSEALHHNPRCGRLWVIELESTEQRHLKKRLVDAVKLSQGAKEVLEFGVGYFRSTGNEDVAKKWQARLTG